MVKILKPAALGAPLGMYSHGMAAPGGEIVIVAGQVGVDGKGQVAGDDVGAQTKQALDNVRAVVEAAGTTMRDVVRLQTFLISADDIPGFMKARSEVFPDYFPHGVFPPNTLLVVSQLVRPELRVEIEAMAIKPSAAERRGGGGRPRRTPPSRKRPTAARRRNR
jgi:enamine deaminase RidA (YjgF/YER057c/UK114 family)